MGSASRLLAALAAVAALVPSTTRRAPLRTVARAVSDEATRLKAEIEQLTLLKEVEQLRREIAADEREYELLAAEDRERRAAEDEKKEALRTSKRAEKDAARSRQKRDAVLRQCVDQNATEVSLVLLNDGVNKRARVQEILVRELRLDPGEAEKLMMKAHRDGAGLVKTYATRSDDLDAAYASYAKLADAGLNVRFEAAGGDVTDAAEVERIAELRDLGQQLKDYNIDILNDDETDLNLPTTASRGRDDFREIGNQWTIVVTVALRRPTTVALNAVVAVVTGLLFSAAWTVGGALGEAAGSSLGGAPPF